MAKVNAAFTSCKNMIGIAMNENLFQDPGAADVEVIKVVAGVDLSSVFEQLQDLSSIDTVEALRVDYLKRFIELCAAAGKVVLHGAAIPASFVDHGMLDKQLVAMSTFLTQSVKDQWSSMECERFLPRIEDSRNLMQFAEQVAKLSWAAMTSTLEKMANDLRDGLPAGRDHRRPSPAHGQDAPAGALRQSRKAAAEPDGDRHLRHAAASQAGVR